MTLTTFPNIDQRSEQWFDQRRGMVTASAVGQLLTVRTLEAQEYACPACGADVDDPCISKRGGAAIKSLHPERTAKATANRRYSPLVIEVADNDTSHALTTLLVAERITGFTDPTWMSNDMFRGLEDEPRALEKYADHYGVKVDTAGFMVRDDWGFSIGYSPDGLVGDDGLIEVKSRKSRIQLTTVLSGEVPAANMAQLQCALLVSGREYVDYVSYAGGMHMWRKRVTPDERWFTAIVDAARNFEKTAEAMTDKYLSAVIGLPMTERVIEMEMTL